MEALLRVEHLKKQFHRNSDGTYVLKDISFEMMPGECLGLIGNSGSGKSTIVKILTGITTATKGCIYLEGKQIYRKKDDKKNWKKSADDFSESEIFPESEDDDWAESG